MTPKSRFALRCAWALAAVGTFSVVFSVLAENGRWPELPPGTLHNVDLAAGVLAALGLVIALAFGKTAPSRRSG